MADFIWQSIILNRFGIKCFSFSHFIAVDSIQMWTTDFQSPSGWSAFYKEISIFSCIWRLFIVTFFHLLFSFSFYPVCELNTVFFIFLSILFYSYNVFFFISHSFRFIMVVFSSLPCCICVLFSNTFKWIKRNTHWSDCSLRDLVMIRCVCVCMCVRDYVNEYRYQMEANGVNAVSSLFVSRICVINVMFQNHKFQFTHSICSA